MSKGGASQPLSAESSNAIGNSIYTRLLPSSYIYAILARIAATVVQTKSYMMSWMKWKPTSQFDLELAESKLLSYLSTPYKGYFVDIGNHANLNNNRIWTIELGPKQTAERPADVNEDQVEEKLPLVLVHGFGAGVGIWSLNLDALSVDRKVYAFDLLGFARSSRPAFDFCNSEEVEWQLIQAIEKWRVEMKLDQKFVLLGHSFGGYLAAAYALNFPHHVGHLILADPWGMPSIQTQQGNTTSTAQYQIPVWVKVVATVVFSTFTPLSVLRGAGPWGPTLVHKFRPDLKKKFEGLIGAEDSDLILNYVYHCNAQDNPSGEKAFKALAQKAGWAKFPIIQRIGELHPDIELTFIYGSRSWIDRQPGFQIKYLLRDRLVDIHVIQGAGHHVYADKHTTFNDLVNNACLAVDEKMGNIALEEKIRDVNLHEQD